MAKFAIANKVAIVTGSADGLGASLSKKLLENGAKVVGIDIDPATLTHPHYLHIQGDITEAAIRKRAVKEAHETFGRVDILANNAATGIYAPSYDSTDAENKRIYDVNIFAPLALIALVTPHFIRQKTGMIVNIGSICGKVTVPWATVYCSTKFALDGISQGLRRELSPHGVHVLHVMPSVMETNFRSRVLRGQAPGKVLGMRVACSTDRVAGDITRAIARKKTQLYTPFYLAYPFNKMQEYAPWLMDWYLASKQ